MTYRPGQLVKCRKCGTSYPWTKEYFRARKRALNGICQPCRECGKVITHAYNHSAKGKERTSAFNASPKGRARTNAFNRSPKGQARTRSFMKAYRATPEGKTYKKIHEQLRHARKLNLPNDYTPDDWLNAQSYFKGCCAVCGEPLRGLFFTAAADHWIALSDPRSDNPGTVPWNIVPLCHGLGGCNNSKRGQNAMEWLTEKYGNRKAKQIEKRIQKYFDTIRDVKAITAVA